MRTIEEDLLEALSKAEAFPPEMKSDLGKVGTLADKKDYCH